MIEIPIAAVIILLLLSIIPLLGFAAMLVLIGLGIAKLCGVDTASIVDKLDSNKL